MTAAPKPSVWQPIVGLLCGFIVSSVAQALVLVGATMLAMRGTSVRDLEVYRGAIEGVVVAPWFIGFSVVLSGACLAGSAIVFGLLLKKPLRQTMQLDGRAHFGIVAIAALAAVAIGIASTSVTKLIGVGSPEVMRLIAASLAKSNPASKVVLAILLAVCPAFSEELMFRGLIQPQFERRWGRWPAILSAALLFGLVHGDPRHVPFAAALGVLLGWITSRTRSLRPAIALHFINNSVASIGLLGGEADGDSSTMGTGPLVGSIIVVAVVVFVLHRLLRGGPSLREAGAS
jgi:membrane protease YdiL (CAAX protease family)